MDAPVEALQAVPEIGPVVAASVRAFADEPRNRALIARLAAAGVNMTSQAAGADRSSAGPLAGKTFVLTGTLDVDDARGGDRGARAARREGRRVGQQEDHATSSPAPTRAASSRRRRQLGVETLDEDAFRRL